MCSITDEVKTEVHRDDKGVPLATVTSDVLTVQVGRSVIDGEPYVMIDTEAPGIIRVDLNDGTIWDGDPEQDQAHWLDGFEIAGELSGARHLLCLKCVNLVKPGTERHTLRAYVADAKLHQCEGVS